MVLLMGDADDRPVQVAITASVPDATVLIDGAETPLALPATIRREPGPMHLRIEADGYRPYDVTVEVSGGAPFFHRADLDRLSAKERQLHDSAHALNALKATLFWTGLGLVSLGPIVALVPSEDSSAQVALYRRFQEARSRSEADRLYVELAQNAATARTVQTVGWVMLGAGAAAVVTWALLLWLAPEPSTKSRSLSMQLGIGPGSLTVFGSF